MSQPIERGPRDRIVPSNGAPLGFLAPRFTGRGAELAQLNSVLSRRSDGLPARCSIVGMPGLGKTQLALKYASQIFDQLNGPMIVWISAATSEKLTLGYCEILNLVDHVDRDHTDQGLKVRTARRWLEGTDQQQVLPWLLVFDNVNENTVPFLREYLPQTNENVAILFTMRSNDVAKALMNPASSAEVQAMLHLEVPNLVDARGLLLAELEAPNEEDTASQVAKAETLVKSIGCLPLAINQVASFVKQHSKNLDYILSLYQSQRQMDIMSWDNQLSTYEQRSVMTTFSSTLDELAKDSPVANLLLQTLSFFDPESIALDMIVDGAYPICDLRAYSEERKPKLSEPPILTRRLMHKLQHKLQHKLLRRSSKVSKKAVGQLDHKIPTINLQDQNRDDWWALKVSELLKDPVECPKAIKQLRLLAFVSHYSDADGETIRVHDLVRSVIRNNARQSILDPLCYRMAAAILDYAFHILDNPCWNALESWSQYEKILPHYRSLVMFQGVPDGYNTELVRASRAVARYLNLRGRHKEAAKTIEVVLVLQHKHLGITDIDYLANLTELAETHALQENWQEAEGLFQQVLKVRQEMLGATHLDTLAAMEVLAHQYAAQGRYEESSSLQEMVFSGRKERLGADHALTLFAQSDLAEIYGGQRRFVEAESMYEETLRSMERTLGSSNSSTLKVVRNLGELKCKLQRLDEADTLLTRALAGLSKEGGFTPWTVVYAERELGVLRKVQGRYLEAEVHFKTCLAGTELLNGTDHIVTTVPLKDIARLYIDMDRFADAERLLRRAASIVESSDALRGSKGLDTDEYIELAFTIEQQSRLAEAKAFYRQALDKSLQHPDPHPIDIVLCTEPLSRVLFIQEHEYAQEAEFLHERALKNLEGALKWLYRNGIYNTQEWWYGLVTIGRILEDEEMSRIALKVQEEKMGFTHPVTQRTLQALVTILHGKGNVEEEEALLERCKEAGIAIRLPADEETPAPEGGDDRVVSAGQDV